MNELETKLNAELDALTALGSPDDIAAKLEAEGIKGHCNTVNSCPLANYVAKKLDCDISKGAFVQVDGLNIAVARIVYVKSSLSNILKQFVKNVDLGKYPKIVYNHIRFHNPYSLYYDWS